MNKNVKSIFPELIKSCAQIKDFSEREPVILKPLILYHVFFYSLLKSGILNDEESLHDSAVKNISARLPTEFKITNVADLREVFSPEIYRIVSGFIQDHYFNVPEYFLGGVFLENLLAFDIINDNNKIKIISNKSGKRNRGVFYTPEKVAEDFISGLLTQLPDEKLKNPVNLRILDLACGCGMFCIQILKYLMSSSTPIKSRLELIHSLTTIDIDDEAVQITRFSLLLFAFSGRNHVINLEEFINLTNNLPNIKCGNILENYIDGKPKANETYDIVVSNPPYLSYYSRHSKLMNLAGLKFDIMKKGLEFIKSPKRVGRINSIMFFIDYAVRVSKPDGYIGLLVDMNIHERLFLDMRRWLIQKLTLLETRFNLKDFPSVNSGQVILYVTKNKFAPRTDVTIKDMQNHNTQVIPYSMLENDNTFYINRQYTKHAAWLESFHNYPKLGEYTKIHTGINVGGSSEQFFFTENTGGNLLPLVLPSMIKEHYLLDPHRTKAIYVDFDKEKAIKINAVQAELGKKNIIVLGKLDRFLKPRLFVRQSADRIIAAFTEIPMICPYSIFVINEPTEYDLRGILTILNSDIVTRYARESGIIRLGKGKQPQIRKSGLSRLPLPKIEDFKKNLSFLQLVADQMTELVIIKGSEAERKRKEINMNIDDLVSSLYPSL